MLLEVHRLAVQMTEPHGLVDQLIRVKSVIHKSVHASKLNDDNGDLQFCCMQIWLPLAYWALSIHLQVCFTSQDDVHIHVWGDTASIQAVKAELISMARCCTCHDSLPCNCFQHLQLHLSRRMRPSRTMLSSQTIAVQQDRVLTSAATE